MTTHFRVLFVWGNFVMQPTPSPWHSVVKCFKQGKGLYKLMLEQPALGLKQADIVVKKEKDSLEKVASQTPD